MLLLMICVALGPYVVLGSPVTVGVGLYVTTVGDVDVSRGTFTATFYAHFSVSSAAARAGQLYPPWEDTQQPNVLAERILLNAGTFPTSAETRKIDSNVNSTVQVRMKGKFYFSCELSSFPFETQTLVIAIEDPKKDTSQLRFVPDVALSDMNANIRVPGWRSIQFNSSERWNMTVREKSYPGSGLNFSRVEFEIYLSRHPMNAFMKTLLPPFFILLIQMFSFTITPENTPTRISIAGSGMVASVMFHVNLQALTPPTGSLLFSDKFMLCTYAVIVYNGLISIAMLKLYGQAREPVMAARVYRLGEALGWCAVPLIFVLLVFDFYDVSRWIGLAVTLVSVCVFLILRRWMRVRARVRGASNGSHMAACCDALSLSDGHGGGRALLVPASSSTPSPECGGDGTTVRGGKRRGRRRGRDRGEGGAEDPLETQEMRLLGPESRPAAAQSAQLDGRAGAGAVVP